MNTDSWTVNFFFKKLFVLSNHIHFFPIVFIVLFLIFKILWFLEALIAEAWCESVTSG